MLVQTLGLWVALSSSAAAPVRSDLELPVCRFAETYQFASATCTLEFRNSSARPISISGLTPGSTRDSVSPDALIVPPHSSAYATATISPTHEVGRTRRIFRFLSDEPGQLSPNRVAEAAGFVASVLDQPKPVLNFGVVKIRSASTEQKISLDSKEVERFKIEKILEAPSYVDARIGNDGRSIIARIKPDAPWGLHQSDFVRLAINTPRQREVWVGVEVDVHGDVVPAANPLSLGLFRKGSRNEFTVRLDSETGKDFRVGRVQAEGLQGDSKVEPCEPARAGCRLVRYTVSEAQPKGQIAAIVRIELPDFNQTVPVYAWGMLVDKDTQVRNFNEEMKASASASDSGAVSKAPVQPVLDLKQALKSGTQLVEPSPPPGRGPLLKWTVLHEELIHGYAVYRAVSQDGPFVRISEETIAKSSDGGDGAGRYQWRDTSAEPGLTYWYYIGTIQNNGLKEALSSPQKITAK